jgi:hypothetical protein
MELVSFDNSFLYIKYVLDIKNIAGTTQRSVHCEHLLNSLVPAFETGSHVFSQRLINYLRIFETEFLRIEGSINLNIPGCFQTNLVILESRNVQFKIIR